ncbi:MAG: hopanoid biosynthesis protein HpnM [Alphaproteobacteria bacterium]|jgi:phospholipid transport system substrate-binding protein|nr:hopanoid biosynthesis protein HpnM [Alphaproteobacteria bacterium]
MKGIAVKAFGALVLSLVLAASVAAADDPAVARIARFHDALLAVMKDGPKLGVEGRYRKLEADVDTLFDLASMTKFTVGPAWAKMTAEEQKALVAAFRRMTIASYARNFNAFKGQRFVTDPKAEDRAPDRLVKAQVVPEGEKPVNLVYRMRESGGTWRVIDVIFEFVSQLATRRSDFASTVASGGAPALVEKLDEISDKLMKGT